MALLIITVSLFALVVALKHNQHDNNL